MSIEELYHCTITAMHHSGDGIATYKNRPLRVPYSCVGDQLAVSITDIHKSYALGTIVEIITPSKERIKPTCAHFGICGGCALQQLDSNAYYALKQQSFETILTQLGVDLTQLSPIVPIGPQSRRRIELKVQRHKKHIKLGFYKPKTHSIIELEECPVAQPIITQIIPILRTYLQKLPSASAIDTIAITALKNGLDINLNCSSPLKKLDQELLVCFAKEQAIVRLSYQCSNTDAAIYCLYDTHGATITLGDVTIALPVGAFLQATEAGQNAIVAYIQTELSSAQHVVDLYSGCGTYSFPLIEQVKAISAFEGSETMVAAMHNAIIAHKLEHRLHVSSRDLWKQPLKSSELAHFDSAIINPPRNGALTQIKQLAYSSIDTIIMVSCNPATFKRDAQQLLDLGYKLTRATAIDQFYWSNHLEVVATFKRQK